MENLHVFHVTMQLALQRICLRGHARPTVAIRDVINRRLLGNFNNLISSAKWIIQIP
jgi:hypothetical protein